MAANENKLKTSLYVGDLHPEVTEKDLIETVTRVAPLLSVHLRRDKISGRSLCYAYVNFWLPCHAYAVLKYLNHALVKGKSIRIMWYERDPIVRKNNNGNLFVKNLDKSITSLLLERIFSKYGTILSCKVADENGVSKGFGFVQFESEDSAIAARSALHDAIVAGKKLYVSKFLRKNERNGAEAGFRSLYVKNLDEDITEDDLKAKFSQYGKVSNAVIMKDGKGKSKGFGFVNFDSPEEAKRAMMSLNREMLGLKNIAVARAMKKSELRKNFNQMSGNTYDDQMESEASNTSIQNLNNSVCEELFSDCGTVHPGYPAKPILTHAVSRRYIYTSLPCPYDTKKANPLTGANSIGKTQAVAGAQTKEQEASKLHEPCEKFPPQPFYSSTCLQPGYDFPNFSCPLKQLSPFHPTGYQYFSSPSIASYPVIAQYTRGMFAANPKEAAALNGYMQKLLFTVKLSTNCDGPKTLQMESSPVTLKMKPSSMLPPLLQNFQQSRSKIRKIVTKMAVNAHSEAVYI